MKIAIIVAALLISTAAQAEQYEGRAITVWQTRPGEFSPGVQHQHKLNTVRLEKDLPHPKVLTYGVWTGKIIVRPLGATKVPEPQLSAYSGMLPQPPEAGPDVMSYWWGFLLRAGILR